MSRTRSTPRSPWALSPWGCPSPWTRRSWVRTFPPTAQAWSQRSLVEGGSVSLGPHPPGGPGWAPTRWHLAHVSRPPSSPAPFSGVKQEQLSPRGQAGPPESLGVPTAQETSVLRGEAQVSEGCDSNGPFIPNGRLPHRLGQRSPCTGPQEHSPGDSRAGDGPQTPLQPRVSCLQGQPWARSRAGASARASPAHGCLPRAPSATAAPSPT